MNNRMMLSFALIASVLMMFVELRAQTNDAPKWITLTSESDSKDSILYQAESDFGGKHYESLIYGRDLEKVEKWKVGKELPISMSNIVANAQNAFHKQYPQFSQFKLMSVNLMHLTLVDDWFFNVEFNGIDLTAGASGSYEDKKINILVLLSGRVIAPTVTAK
jgi:hypothetical protein